MRCIYTKDPNINLVIWRGYGIPNTNYLCFGRAIQDYGRVRDLNVNIYIPDSNIIPRECKKNVVLFGHSQGGFDCLKYEDDRIMGKITYGATHNSERRLYMGMFKIPKSSSYPSLSIIGERDGYISYNNLRDEGLDDQLHKTICIRETNHLCISKNTHRPNLISRVFNLRDNPTSLSDMLMINRVSSVVIDYLLYLYRGDRSIDIHLEYTRYVLSRPAVNNITNFVDFLRAKPDANNTYTHESSKHVYIKSYRRVLRKFVFHKRCYTTLEWIMRRDTDKILYFCFMDFVYVKIPRCIFYHESVRYNNHAFWFERYLDNYE